MLNFAKRLIGANCGQMLSTHHTNSPVIIQNSAGDGIGGASVSKPKLARVAAGTV